MSFDIKDYEHLPNKERMLQGFPYDPYTKELLDERTASRKLTREFNDSDDADEEARRKILKRLIPNSGEKIFIEPPFRCDYGTNITVGENFFMNFDCCILDVSHVKIGKNFLAGPAVHFYSATHPTDVLDRRVWEYGKPITVGDDVWIGGMTVICPGVTIGNGVTVGAGSVVTKDVPDYCVVAGNPAKIIRRVEKPKE